jgi:hypothetical protein
MWASFRKAVRSWIESLSAFIGAVAVHPSHEARQEPFVAILFCGMSGISQRFRERKQQGHHFRWPFLYSLSIFWQEWCGGGPYCADLKVLP